MCEQLLYLNETRPSIRLSQSFVQSSDPVGRRKVMERCESVGTDEGIYFYSFPSKLCIAAAESPAADFYLFFFRVELKLLPCCFNQAFS